MNLIEVAKQYRRSGLCPLPTMGGKRPVTGWKQFQEQPPCEDWIEAAFPIVDGICILTGKTSNGLIAIDFDCQGELFESWMELIRAAMPEIISLLVIQCTPSGGYHVLYRIAGEVPGNRKLAHKMIRCDSCDEQHYRGKNYTPVQLADRFGYVVVPIETRGEGGLVLCYPSPNYSMVQGELTSIPILSAEDHADIMDLTSQLDDPNIERPAPKVVAQNIETGIPVTHRNATPPIKNSTTSLPGDDFNIRGNIRPILQSHGWTLVKQGENEYWRRPGKTDSHSATLKHENGIDIFYVHSSNTDFDTKGNNNFQVYAVLEHNNDFNAASAALRLQGYGCEAALPVVDLSKMLADVNDEHDEDDEPKDPGPTPESLLSIPGFINDVANHSMATSPRPNRAISFGAALALQGHLCGRKVRDERGSRTHIFLLCLAASGTGKDWPRQVNTDILFQSGMVKTLGDGIASGEGLEDKISMHLAMLFQTDEIDSLFSSIAKDKSGTMEKIVTMLLKMYTSAGSQYPIRAKSAGADSDSHINQPSLSIFGTALPSLLYESLTKKMLCNGFFGRLLILEAGEMSDYNDASIVDIPKSILEVASYWSEFYKANNLQPLFPKPKVVAETPDAKEYILTFIKYADAQIRKANRAGNEAHSSLWSRAGEKVKKLALIYACSANHLDPIIDFYAAEWAVAFIIHQTDRMLYMISRHSTEGEFDSRMKRVIDKMERWRDSEIAKGRDGKWMPFMKLSKNLPWSDRDHDEIRNALVSRKQIVVGQSNTKTFKGKIYRLVRGSKEWNSAMLELEKGLV